MITPILILSSIFILIAFIVTEKNAKYLLSGYNTMSEEDRQNIDIKSYIHYFRNFHLFLGISLLIISLVLFYFINPDWSILFIGTYPIMAYTFFIWRGNRYVKTKNKKQKIMTAVSIFIMLTLFLYIVFDLVTTLKNNEIVFTDNKIEITGEYGTKINTTEIKSIELVDQLPEIASKTNGFSLATIKKGDFKTKDKKNVKLFINSQKTPIILIKATNNQQIYYSSKEKSNEEIFNELSRKIAKK